MDDSRVPKARFTLKEGGIVFTSLPIQTPTQLGFPLTGIPIIFIGKRGELRKKKACQLPDPLKVMVRGSVAGREDVLSADLE